jgi:hypothetical protein
VFVFAGCASVPPEKAVIDGAASALGGAEKVQAVKTVTIQGGGENLNLGQNQSPDAQQPIFKVSEFKRTIDFAGNRSRLDQVRTATVGNTAPARQIQGLDGDVAFNVNAAGVATRASAQVAKDRRAELYHHPIGALRAALAQGAVIANPRKEGNDDVVDITTADGSKLTLYVDSQTKLPSKVKTMSDNIGGPLGDFVVETSFANYADTNGLKLPPGSQRRTTSLRWPTFKFQRTRSTLIQSTSPRRLMLSPRKRRLLPRPRWSRLKKSAKDSGISRAKAITVCSSSLPIIWCSSKPHNTKSARRLSSRRPRN